MSSTNLTVLLDVIPRSSIVDKSHFVSCGNPAGTDFHAEKQSLANLTLCDLFLKK